MSKWEKDFRENYKHLKQSEVDEIVCWIKKYLIAIPIEPETKTKNMNKPKREDYKSQYEFACDLQDYEALQIPLPEPYIPSQPVKDEVVIELKNTDNYEVEIKELRNGYFDILRDLEKFKGMKAYSGINKLTGFETKYIEDAILICEEKINVKYNRLSSPPEPSSKEQEGDAVGLLDWMAINHYREVGYDKEMKLAQFAQFEGNVCCSDYFSKEQLYQLYTKNKNL